MRVVRSCAAGIVLVLVQAPAGAFVRNCHVDITTEALEGAAWPLARTPPPLTGDYVYLVNELSVDLAPTVRNLWGMGVLVGNQYNDQGPYRRDDISAIAEIAALPDAQREHCLRAPADDGAAGEVTALAACKAYILEQIAAGLGESSEPDLDVTEVVRLSLLFRGKGDVPLPRFAFHLGHAIHALQDSFTHSFRTPDRRRVRSVLNYVDWINAGNYVEERDGFQHITALDNCGASDEGGMERRTAARQATSELLAAVADDRGGRAGRLARAGAVVDAWLGLEEGCTAANRWCDAPEQDQTGAIGCAVGTGGRSGAPGGLVLLLAAAAAIAWRRRLVVLAILGLAAPAGADEPTKADSKKGEVDQGILPKATAGEQRLLTSRPFGILIKTGLAIDNGAAEIGAGFRYDLNKTWTVGIGAQWSPWYSIEAGRTTAGTADVFAVGVFRLDVRDYLELRVTAGLGISVLLFDTWSAQSGSVGPYVELSPVGVAFRMGARLRLLIEPAEIVIPVPQTRGIPLIYRQHRFSIALQSNF